MIFKSLKEAQELMAIAVKDYNGCRPHMSCHDMTPNKFHLQRELPVKTWKCGKDYLAQSFFNFKNGQGLAGAFVQKVTLLTFVTY